MWIPNKLYLFSISAGSNFTMVKDFKHKNIPVYCQGDKRIGLRGKDQQKNKE